MALQCLSSIIFPVKVIYLPVNVEIKVGSYLNVILDSDLYVSLLPACGFQVRMFSVFATEPEPHPELPMWL